MDAKATVHPPEIIRELEGLLGVLRDILRTPRLRSRYLPKLVVARQRCLLALHEVEIRIDMHPALAELLADARQFVEPMTYMKRICDSDEGLSESDSWLLAEEASCLEAMIHGLWQNVRVIADSGELKAKSRSDSGNHREERIFSAEKSKRISPVPTPNSPKVNDFINALKKQMKRPREEWGDQNVFARKFVTNDGTTTLSDRLQKDANNLLRQVRGRFRDLWDPTHDWSK